MHERINETMNTLIESLDVEDSKVKLLHRLWEEKKLEDKYFYDGMPIHSYQYEDFYRMIFGISVCSD